MANIGYPRLIDSKKCSTGWIYFNFRMSELTCLVLNLEAGDVT